MLVNTFIKMKTLSFETVPQIDTIMCLGAGPSLKDNLSYIKKMKNIVTIGCMPSTGFHYSDVYDYEFKLDYILLRTKYLKKFCSNPNNHDKPIKIAKNFILGDAINQRMSKLSNIYKYINKYNNFFWKPIEYRPQTEEPVEWMTEKIVINDAGIINHNPHDSGLVCVLLSVFFKPKRVIMAGIDGFTNFSQNAEQCQIPHFDLSGKIYNKNAIKTMINHRRLSIPKIINFLQEHGIEVYIFPNTALWGLNPNLLKINCMNICF